MPKRFNNKKSRSIKKKRRRYVRRRKAYTRRRRFPGIARAIMPSKKLVKFKYVDYYDFLPQPSLGAPVVSATWRCNDLNDPYDGVGGHQPYMYDQWAAFYSRFVVLGAKITVFPDTDLASNDTAVRPMRFWVSLSDDAKSSSFYNTSNNGNILWEINTPGGRKRSNIGHWNSDTSTSKYTSRKSKYATLKFSAKKFFEVSNVMDKLEQLSAPIEATSGGPTSAPTNLAYFDVCVAPSGSAWGLTSTDPTVPCKMRIIVQYVAMLYDRVSTGES